MTDPFLDHALSDQDRSAVHDFALHARQRLTQEAHELLEGVYQLSRIRKQRQPTSD